MSQDPAERVKEILGNFELPRFRKTIFETLKRLRDPDSSTNQICQVMSMDADLTSRVMRTVNSTAYAPRSKITTLDHAIAMMGNSQLERIVMLIGARGTVPQKLPQYLALQQFWKTAGKRAVLAKEIAEATKPAVANLCFTAGFLQDIAVPLIASSKGEDYNLIYSTAAKGERALHEAEKEALGWCHAELGAAVCAVWDMPEDLTGAIKDQNVTDSRLRPDAVHYVASLCDAHPETWNEDFSKIVVERHPEFGPDQVKAMITACGGKADELAKLIS